MKILIIILLLVLPSIIAAQTICDEKCRAVNDAEIERLMAKVEQNRLDRIAHPYPANYIGETAIKMPLSAGSGVNFFSESSVYGTGIYGRPYSYCPTYRPRSFVRIYPSTFRGLSHRQYTWHP